MKGDVFGEGCLTGQPRRLATATAMAESVSKRLSQEQRMDFFWVPYRSGPTGWLAFLRRFPDASKALGQGQLPAAVSFSEE
jgi:hypothetical protein